MAVRSSDFHSGENKDFPGMSGLCVVDCGLNALVMVVVGDGDDAQALRYGCVNDGLRRHRRILHVFGRPVRMNVKVNIQEVSAIRQVIEVLEIDHHSTPCEDSSSYLHQEWRIIPEVR